VSFEQPIQTHVSRETRRLLAAAGLALLSLWVLARLRYPERPVPANPVSPVLTQIASSTTFTDLATEVADLRERLEANGVPLTVSAGPGGAALLAWPLTSETVMTIGRIERGSAVGEDAPTGLAVIRASSEGGEAQPVWTPRALDQPRYLFAATLLGETVAVTPLYVPRLVPVQSPAWRSGVWAVPDTLGSLPGAFLFTPAAQWVGVVVEDGGHTVIVPAATMRSEATTLLQGSRVPAGPLGVEVQAIDPAISAAARADRGVVVTWVDRHGPLATLLAPGDVIESAQATPIESVRAWDVFAARLTGGDDTTLRVWRDGTVSEVHFTPRAAADAGVDRLRMESGTGARVLALAATSRLSLAGLREGDLITRIDYVDAPTPAQVRQALKTDRAVLVAVTRGAGHLVMAVEP